MIVVVADTSPLNYLIQIDCQGVLPALFRRVFIPTAVARELDHPRTRAVVGAFLRQMPQWVAVGRRSHLSSHLWEAQPEVTRYELYRGVRRKR